MVNAHRANSKPHQRKLSAALLSGLVLCLPLGLAGCGFHLRGYQTPLNFEISNVNVAIDDDRLAFPLKRPLTQRLQLLGLHVVDAMGAQINTADQKNTSRIQVQNVRFKKYELVGVLTEIRLVLSADVTYHTLQNGRSVTITNPIQIEQSYQYNRATVSTEDQQGEQVRQFLYDSLARRIADQYVAISLPKAAAKAQHSGLAAPLVQSNAVPSTRPSPP